MVFRITKTSNANNLFVALRGFLIYTKPNSSRLVTTAIVNMAISPMSIVTSYVFAAKTMIHSPIRSLSIAKWVRVLRIMQVFDYDHLRLNIKAISLLQS